MDGTRKVNSLPVTAHPRATVWRERDALSTAVGTLADALARGAEAPGMLRAACDAVIGASPRLRLAWTFTGDPGVDPLRPDYRVGPAGAALDGGDAPAALDRLAPAAHQALAGGRPLVLDLRATPRLRPGAPDAEGLASLLLLPVGRPGLPRALIAVYTDAPDYFEDLGLKPFLALAQLATVAIERASLYERIEDLSTVDELTGLLNRRTFHEVVAREHVRARRGSRPYSLILFDLDRFKLINDRYGHTAGDRTLARLARVAERVLRPDDWLARWGGQQFLWLLPNTGNDVAALLAERLRRTVAEQRLLPPGHMEATISAGVATCPRHGPTLSNVLNAAELALYEAKRGGRNRVADASTRPHRVFSVASCIATALENGQLQAAYQPIVDLATGDVVAEEALARLTGARRRPLEARRFIDAACQLQLAHRIDFEIVRQALAHCAQQVLGERSRLQFVNLSADLLRHPELLEGLCALATERRCTSRDGAEGAHALVIEITEREFLGETRAVERMLTPLLDAGIQLAVDDFGSGFSSFRYLADLPVTFLKMDGELVRRAAHQPKVRAILEGIQDTARHLGVTTVAEWVEDEPTVEVLREIGVDWAQGFLYGRPHFQMPALPARTVN